MSDTPPSTRTGTGMRHVKTASIAAVLNTVSQGAIGTGFWLLAARLYSDADVGAAIAATSLVLVISALAQLNLHTSLSRFLPSAGASQRAHVRDTYRLTIAISVALAVIVVLAGELRGGSLVNGGDRTLTLIVALSLPVWTVFALQDSILVSVRRALWVPVENTVVAVLKVAILPVLVFSSGGGGVLAAWVLPSVLAVAYVTRALWRDILCPGDEVVPDRRRFLRFSMLDFPGALAYLVSLRIVPVLIVEHDGAAGAFPSLAFTIVSTAAFVLPTISLGLLAELSHEGADRAAMVTRSIRLVVFAAFPICLLAAALARPMLRLAGADYATGGAQVLAFGVVGLAFGALAEIGLTSLRGQDRVSTASIIQVVRGIAIVAGTIALLPSNSARLVGVVFAVANAVTAAAALGVASRRSSSPDRVGDAGEVGGSGPVDRIDRDLEESQDRPHLTGHGRHRG